MFIWALDIGVNCGFACGVVGQVPTSGVLRLKKPTEHPSVAGSNLIHHLQMHWGSRKPDLVCKEAPLALQAFANLGNAAATVSVTMGLHAIVEAMATRFGIPFENIHVATIRKHFTGRGKWGTREQAKRATVQRCHLLKLMPLDCHDDNRADAIAAYDYAAQTFGRQRPNDLHLFGETTAA